MSGYKDETVQCEHCGEDHIPIKQQITPKGFIFYGLCPKCKKKTIIEEVDTT